MRKQLMGLLVPVFVFAAMTNAAAGDMTAKEAAASARVAEDRDRARPGRICGSSSKPRARWHPRCQRSNLRHALSSTFPTRNGDGAEPHQRAAAMAVKDVRIGMDGSSA